MTPTCFKNSTRVQWGHRQCATPWYQNCTTAAEHYHQDSERLQKQDRFLAPTANDLESPFFLINGRDPLEGHTGLLAKGDIRYLGDEKGLILFIEIHRLWLAHAKALQENRQLKTDKVKRNKHFKAHNFKIGQPIAVKNHLRNTFESKFIADYRVLEIVNDHTLIVESPDGKTRWININDAKTISTKAATYNALQDFKLSTMKQEHMLPLVT